MKKLFITALFAASVFTNAFAAGANEVSSKTVNNFRYEFNGAANVEWTVKQDFTKAAFTVNNEKSEAYYDTDGNLIASSRTIDLEKMPAAAKRAFSKKYGEYAVKEAIEFYDNVNTAYYVSAENEKEVVVIKIVDSNVSVFKTTKK